MGENARLNIEGNFNVGAGTDIRIFKNAELTIGNHVWIGTRAIIRMEVN